MSGDFTKPYTLDEIIEFKLAHGRRHGATPAECEAMRNFTISMAKCFGADFVAMTFALESVMHINDTSQIQNPFAGKQTNEDVKK
jgi:hypothetical protein